MDTVRIDSATPAGIDSTPPLRGPSGWAAGAHLIALFFSIVGAILILVIVGKDDAFVRQHARQAVNLQLNIFAGALGSALLSALTPAMALLWVPIGIAAIVFPILGAVRANRGEWRPYPNFIPFLRSLPQPARA